MHHDSVPLNNLQCKIIELADGERNLQQIATDLTDAVAKDEVLLAEYTQMVGHLPPDESSAATDTAEQINPEFVEQAISYLAYHGLLDFQ